MVRRLGLVLLAALFALGCDPAHVTEFTQVDAKVVAKHRRKQRRYVVVEYQGHRGRIRDREAYRSKNIGDAYPACLFTYEREKSGERFRVLGACPEK